ncbi:MAG: hypothetical protein HUU08_13385 [Candidatus Brocadia sp.]|nr:hypothetical protein [Candidatus Brocadia sp.]
MQIEQNKKKKLIVIFIFITTFFILILNPYSVRVLISPDRNIGYGLFYSLLLITSLLIMLLFFYILNLKLLKKGKMQFPNFIINFTTFFYTIFILLLATEILFRYVIKPHEPVELYTKNDYFGMMWHKPNLNVRLITEEFDVNFRTNNIGLRDDRELTAKCENEIRIMNLGDSCVQAAQIDLKETMTYKLEENLNSHDSSKKYRVFNVGTSGCNPSYQRKFLEKNIKKFDLDYLLLFLYIGNDIITTLDIKPLINPPSDIQIMYTSSMLSLTKISKLFKFFYLRLNTEPEWGGPRGPRGRPCQPFDAEPLEKTANLFLKEYNNYIKNAYLRVFDEISRINNICKINNIDFTVFIIPTKEQVEPKKFEETINFLHVDKNSLDMEKPQRLISEFLNDNQIKYIDLLDTLTIASKIKDTYFDFDPHWNAYGNEVVSEEVTKYLIRTLHLPVTWAE